MRILIIIAGLLLSSTAFASAHSDRFGRIRAALECEGKMIGLNARARGAALQIHRIAHRLDTIIEIFGESDVSLRMHVEVPEVYNRLELVAQRLAKGGDTDSAYRQLHVLDMIVRRAIDPDPRRRASFPSGNKARMETRRFSEDWD